MRIHAVQFHFEALDEVRFPAHAGNTWRGALGTLLQQVDEQAYGRWFRPQANEKLAASGYRNPPRPFVFRAAQLNARCVMPGTSFAVGMNWFIEPPTDLLETTFDPIQRQGISGGRARLTAITEQEAHWATIEATCRRALVRFVTPTEIKSGGAVLRTAPDFHTLLARTKERVEALTTLYGGASPDVTLDGASDVECVESSVEWQPETRRSRRTGQKHKIGGLMGEAIYEGDLAQFLPLLRLAYWTGIGRHTAWGNGMIATERTA